MGPPIGLARTSVEVITVHRYSHDHSIASEVLSLECPSLRFENSNSFCGTYVLSVWFTQLIGFGNAAFGYFLDFGTILRICRSYQLNTRNVKIVIEIARLRDKNNKT